MNRFAGFKNFTQGILFIILILLGFIFISFMTISVIGNIQLSCQNKEIKAPDIDKAQFKVYVKATRQTYFTNNYELTNNRIYWLHGYYEPKNGKYIYNPSTILIDREYWGEIIITKR